MRVVGSVLAVVRIGLAIHDGLDMPRRARLRTSSGAPSTGAGVAIARELVQGVLLVGAGRNAHRVGGAVDALHAFSMLAYGLARPGRGAAAEAARAAALALAEWTLP